MFGNWNSGSEHRVVDQRLADLVDQVGPSGLVDLLVRLGHERRGLLVAPAGGAVALVVVLGRRDLVAVHDGGHRGIRRRRLDEHAEVVVQRGEPLLEQRVGVRVVGDDLEAGLVASQRQHQGLGVLTALVAGVDRPPDRGDGAVLGPVAVGALGPAVLGEQRLGAGRVVEVRELGVVAPRADRRDPQAAVQQLGAGEDRIVDGLQDQLTVDRLREGLAEDRIGERPGRLLEPQGLVVGPVARRVLDVRVVQRVA